MSPRPAHAVLALAVFLGCWCASLNAAPKTESFPVEVEVPTLKLEPAPDYPPIKEMGGVRIELIPVPAETKKMKLVTLEARTGAADFLTTNMKSVWVWETPVYEILPEDLQFQVRITNHVGKILRFQGVALTFSVNGKNVPTDYAKNDIGSAMLTPNASWEGILHGPPADALQQSGMLLVGIYDVITEVDAANNPTKRTNFEWVYSYNLTKTKQQDQKTRTKGSVTAQQAAALQNSRHPAE